MLALVASLACGPEPQAPPPPAPAVPRPALVVLLVVDQLPTRLLDRVLPLASGGLKRLAGGYVATVRHPFIPTETCPGHAAISTGASPSRSGIVANAWFDGGEVYCIPDEKDARLLVADALADRVTDAGGRAVALGLKDRGAILLGGHHPTAEAWFAYGEGGAVRGRGIEALGPVPEWRCQGERTWTPLHPEAYGALFPDDQPFERDDTPAFPHTAKCDDARRFVSSPDAGAWLVDVAIGASDRLALGRGDAPDLLAVSFSQVDIIGHSYTPDSWETLDAMVRLDRDLGRLFEHLDRTVGTDHYAVLLTADHGAPPGFPDRIPAALEEKALRAAAGAAGLPGDDLPPFGEPWVWFPRPLAPEARARGISALRAELVGHPGIVAVVDTADAGTRPADPRLAEAVALGTYPGRSGDVAVLRADGWQWEWRIGPGKVEARGTTHGSTDPRDAEVPLLLVGAGVSAGRAAAVLDVRQVAPTAAALLGVEAPRDAELGPVDVALAR